jgi:hypothetical protein
VRDETDRFVQLRVLGIDAAYERLRSVGAPDPIAAVGLLTSLVMDAEWRERGRGVLRGTIDGFAEMYGGVHRSRIRRLMHWLEAADLIRCEWVRGHEGEVLILAYDQVVEVPQRALARSATRARAEATRSGAEATRSGAERPGETGPTTNKEQISQGEKDTKSIELDRASDTFPQGRDRPPAQKDRDEPEDALKCRCLNLFVPRGVSHDDCVRAIDQLRCEDIADHLIDAALGQCEKKADVQSPGYLLKVARNWYRQRTGGVT